jgi:hypothetical protein
MDGHMDIILRKSIRRIIVLELFFLSFAMCIIVLAIISSYQLLIFSDIRFPDIYYEFEGMYLLFLLLCIMFLNEIVILIHLLGFIKWRKNLSWIKSILIIVVIHVVVGVLTFLSIKYTIAGSNSMEISNVFYVFVSLFLIECVIIGFLSYRLHKTK